MSETERHGNDLEFRATAAQYDTTRHTAWIWDMDMDLDYGYAYGLKFGYSYASHDTLDGCFLFYFLRF
jgi:hypothetical protein